MRLPDVLIIGAMKSGTTGVFLDLCRHPGVFEQANKEPHGLCHDEVLTSEGVEAYADVFAGASADQLVCDGSTGYSKLPDLPGVVDRALKLLPDGFRVIYVVRDPIDRMVSHHHHEFVEGKVPASIDQTVRQHPRYLNYSRYGYQLTPWLEAIGRDRVMVVRFEDYKADRRAVTARVCKWLNLDETLLPPADETIHNQAAGKPLITGFWRSVQGNPLYHYVIRPLMSPRARGFLQRLVLPKAPERPEPPTPETLAWLKSQLADEVHQISDYAGSDELLWGGYDAPSRAVAAPKA